MAPKPLVALLRGINVGGHHKIPMAELRDLCAEFGWRDVQTYIQSGNVVFRGDGTAKQLEATLERGIEARFGFAIPVVVQSAARWSRWVASNPYAEAARTEPNLVMLGVAKQKPARGALAWITERASANERVTLVGEALWIHYGDGVARSKLTPAVLDRAAGSSVTTRNWRTVIRLAELLQD